MPDTNPKHEAQSFALILAEADGGLLNQQLSAVVQAVMDELDDHSMLHDTVAKGEITLKFKISNDRGKVLVEPAEPKIKLPPRNLTAARFYRDEDGRLTTQDPRVAGDLFKERALAVKAEKQAQKAAARSAPAPKVAGDD